MEDQEPGTSAPPPTELGKNLRCCYGCRLVKSFAQFYEQGCDNCPFLALDGDKERIYDSTTTEFSVSVGGGGTGGGACVDLNLRSDIPGTMAG